MESVENMFVLTEGKRVVGIYQQHHKAYEVMIQMLIAEFSKRLDESEYDLEQRLTKTASFKKFVDDLEQIPSKNSCHYISYPIEEMVEDCDEGFITPNPRPQGNDVDWNIWYDTVDPALKPGWRGKDDCGQVAVHARVDATNATILTTMVSDVKYWKNYILKITNTEVI